MSDPKILLIETSAELCSVALCEGSRIISSVTSDKPRAHASLTAQFVKDILEQNGMKAGGLDAVCVCSGPGSYTGLRVGVSTAKGLCFGAGIPLIAINTPDILVSYALGAGLLNEGCTTIIPMIDARRMEVYCAEYSSDGRRLTDIEAKVVDNDTFSATLAKGPVLFIGDGALKCKDIIANPQAHFVNAAPLAEMMAADALKAWHEKRFENIAYFEPFYLKQFVATVSRKSVLPPVCGH